MDFEEFLPPQKEEIEEAEEETQKISQNQFYDVITSRKPDWQQIIYELIDSEQLDPWDIDLVVLTRKYFEKIALLEEADFYISSKVLLAAALLLRIKSEYLLNKYIKSIDDALFGRKDDKRPLMERIIIDENDLPILIPKTPLPRMKKVTLNELIIALNKAIETESRRIRKEVAIKRAKKLSEVDFPTFRRIDLKDRIKQFYARILTTIKRTAITKEKHHNTIAYSNVVGIDREEKVACFLPLLHLSNTRKLWIEQEKHLDEIYIYLYQYFDKNRADFIKNFKEVTEEIFDEDFANAENLNIEKVKDSVMKSIEETENLFTDSQRFDSNESSEAEISAADEVKQDILNNKLSELDVEIDDEVLDPIVSDEDIKEEIRNEILEEVEKEEKILEKEEKLDETTGFSQE